MNDHDDRLAVPADFSRRMRELHGPAGGRWLAELPALLAELATRWSLALQAPFEPLSYNYVAPVRCNDGRPAVLKVGFPNDELQSEIAALQLYAGRGCARLLAAAPARGALLLERLQPGRPLLELPDDDQATTIAAGAMRQLWRPLPAGQQHPFPSTVRWAAGLERLRAAFDGRTGPFPAGLVDAAEQLFAELHASAGESVLLHGDLHHWNILQAQRAPWLALDPKGVVGEREYEVGAWLRNPIDRLPGQAGLVQLLGRRLDILAEALTCDRERLRCWGLAQAVLSSWWSYEDHHAPGRESLAVARALHDCG